MNYDEPTIIRATIENGVPREFNVRAIPMLASSYDPTLLFKRGAELARLEETVSAKLRDETYVRLYFEQFSTAHEIQIAGDLDEEEKQNKRRGDYRATYEQQNVIVEVEKDVADFTSHSHRTEGPRGWNNVGSIDLLFAATDRGERADDFDIPVVLASATADAPSFDEWYSEQVSFETARDAVQFSYLLAVYSQLAEGIPSNKELRQAGVAESELDRFGTVRSIIATAVAEAFTEVRVSENDFDTDQSPEAAFEQLIDDTLRPQVIEQMDTAEDEVCTDCESSLLSLGSENYVFDPMGEASMDTMTEGQWADQYAASIGGAFEPGIHGTVIHVLYCPDCSKSFIQESR